LSPLPYLTKSCLIFHHFVYSLSKPFFLVQPGLYQIVWLRGLTLKLVSGSYLMAEWHHSELWPRVNSTEKGYKGGVDSCNVENGYKGV
jgi:hypothetical protein